MEAMRTSSSTLAAARQCGLHFGGASDQSRMELRERILQRTCPEDLRLAVVAEFLHAECRLPAGTSDAERAAHGYLGSALGRRYVSTDSGEQLSPAQVAQWDALLQQVPDDARPSWEADAVLARAREYFDKHGHLEVPNRKKAASEEEAKLEHDMRLVRRALRGDQRDRQGNLLRRQLTAEAVAAWESASPGVWRWSSARQRGHSYLGAVVKGERHEWHVSGTSVLHGCI